MSGIEGSGIHTNYHYDLPPDVEIEDNQSIAPGEIRDTTSVASQEGIQQGAYEAAPSSPNLGSFEVITGLNLPGGVFMVIVGVDMLTKESTEIDAAIDAQVAKAEEFVENNDLPPEQKEQVNSFIEILKAIQKALRDLDEEIANYQNISHERVRERLQGVANQSSQADEQAAIIGEIMGLSEDDLNELKNCLKKGEELPEKFAPFEKFFNQEVTLKDGTTTSMLDQPEAREQLASMVDTIWQSMQGDENDMQTDQDGSIGENTAVPFNNGRTSQAKVEQTAIMFADEIAATKQVLEDLGFPADVISNVVNVLTRAAFGQYLQSADGRASNLVESLENNAFLIELFDSIGDNELAGQMLSTIILVTVGSIALRMAENNPDLSTEDLEAQVANTLDELSEVPFIRNALGDETLAAIHDGTLARDIVAGHAFIDTGKEIPGLETQRTGGTRLENMKKLRADLVDLRQSEVHDTQYGPRIILGYHPKLMLQLDSYGISPPGVGGGPYDGMSAKVVNGKMDPWWDKEKLKAYSDPEVRQGITQMRQKGVAGGWEELSDAEFDQTIAELDQQIAEEEANSTPAAPTATATTDTLTPSSITDFIEGFLTGDTTIEDLLAAKAALLAILMLIMQSGPDFEQLATIAGNVGASNNEATEQGFDQVNIVYTPS